jgi:large subunit ribosomal protein L9
MQVILKQDVRDLGLKGALVNVADGFARNYLIPRGLAVAATDSNLKQRQQRLNVQTTKAERVFDSAQVLAERLDGLSITVHARTGEGGKLFGSVTAQDIADGVKAVGGVEVDKRKVDLPDTIKAIGVYRVLLRLHPKVRTAIEVRVEPE